MNKQLHDAGVRWLKGHHKEVRLADLIHKAADQDTELPLVDLLAWALGRGPYRQDLVPLVLTEEGPGKPADALMADPLALGGESRRRLFPQPALVAAYANIDDRAAVVAFLERLGVCGAGTLEVRTERMHRYERGRVATRIGVHAVEVKQANDAGYQVHDRYFPFPIDGVPPAALQEWLTLSAVM